MPAHYQGGKTASTGGETPPLRVIFYMIWTIKTLLDWSTKYFQDKEIESARLDAELLLAHTLKIRRLDLYLQFDRPLKPEELADYKSLLQRRIFHEPVAYITGKKEFWSREFFVTPDVLIPRPDTEVLIEVARENMSEKKHGFEIGLGSGILAITLLLEFPELKMTAIEVSEKAIAVAKKNADFHHVSDRLEIIHGDFFKEQISKNSYDFIISNPPYVSESEMLTLSPTILKYEPQNALIAGPQGLDFYPAIAEFSRNHLKENGFVAVEMGETQAESVKNIFLKSGFLTLQIKKDYGQKDRVLWVKRR